MCSVTFRLADTQDQADRIRVYKRVARRMKLPVTVALGEGLGRCQVTIKGDARHKTKADLLMSLKIIMFFLNEVWPSDRAIAYGEERRIRFSRPVCPEQVSASEILPILPG